MSGTSRRRLVNIDLFTDAYRVSGRAEVGLAGLYGELTDQNTSYLEMQEVYISRIHEPAKIVGYYKDGIFQKPSINFVLLQDRQDGIPTGSRSVFTVGRPLPIFLTVPAFEVSGHILQQGKFTSTSNTIMLSGGEFQLIFEAKASASLYPGIFYTGDLLLINKKRAGIFCLKIDDELS